MKKRYFDFHSKKKKPQLCVLKQPLYWYHSEFLSLCSITIGQSTLTGGLYIFLGRLGSHFSKWHWQTFTIVFKPVLRTPHSTPAPSWSTCRECSLLITENRSNQAKTPPPFLSFVLFSLPITPHSFSFSVSTRAASLPIFSLLCPDHYVLLL